MKKYLAMWDNTGLEYLYCHTDNEKLEVWNTLKGVPPPRIPDVGILKLRAQANQHRHYEIYAFAVEDDVTEESIREAFKLAPQGIVNMIREIGYKIYSNRAMEKPVIV